MADQRVNIKVTTQGATKAKQEMGGLSGAIGKMGKAVGIASAAYFGARGLISGFSSVITLAGEQEQAEKRLEVALGKTSQALLNKASALSHSDNPKAQVRARARQVEVDYKDLMSKMEA